MCDQYSARTWCCFAARSCGASNRIESSRESDPQYSSKRLMHPAGEEAKHILSVAIDSHVRAFIQQLCSSKGISNSGNKKELVARLPELGTIEQKKLLLQGISQSNSTDICKELFVRHGSFCQRKDIQRRNSIKRIGVHVCNYLRQQFWWRGQNVSSERHKSRVHWN